MHAWFRKLRQAFEVPRPVRRSSCELTVEHLEDCSLLSSGYVQAALVSDVPGLAPNTDRKLVNPWGFSETDAGQFRVAANGTGRGILLDAQVVHV